MLFGRINEAVFDWPWSGIHLASGFFIGLTLAILIPKRRPGRFWFFGGGLLVLWEVVELTLQYLDLHAHDAIAPFKEVVGGFAFAPETVANLIGDLMIGSFGLSAGFILVRAFAQTK